MINCSYYRLAEYKIIKGEDGHIWWEKHSGFCAVKMGSCFVNGSILFIEPSHTSQENGFLKGEFIDQLNSLPKWEKTKYYCTNFKIFKCEIDQNRKHSSTNNQFLQSKNQGDISYRLGQFEIIEKMDGKLLWKSYSGREAIKVGTGYIDSNILFLRLKEVEKAKIIKQDFLQRLFRLPIWEKTNFFCHHYTLYSCETNEICFGLESVLSNKAGNNIGVLKKMPHQIESNFFNPKPATVTFTQDYLKKIWSFCSISLLFILKLLFGLIIIILKALKIVVEKCVLGGKRLVRRVLRFLK
jgi:hypothetical protein